MTWSVRDLAKVLEYYPAPWNTWVKIGNLPSGRALHAVLPIGPQHIACVAGEELLKSSVFSSYDGSLPSELLFDRQSHLQNAPNFLLLTVNHVSPLLEPRYKIL